jgi:hypothetical protein
MADILHREMHRRTGRKVQIVGFSQGGLAPRSHANAVLIA